MPYSFDVTHRPGAANAVPDALSRAPVDQPEEEDDSMIFMHPVTVNSLYKEQAYPTLADIFDADEQAPHSQLGANGAEGQAQPTLEAGEHANDPVCIALEQDMTAPDELPAAEGSWTRTQYLGWEQAFRAATASDDYANMVIQYLSESKLPASVSSQEEHAQRHFAIEASMFEIHDGLLMRRVDKDGELKHYVPATFRTALVLYIHSSYVGGHLGARRTYEKVYSLFWWPHMLNAIHKIVKSCRVCQRVHNPTGAVPGLLMHMPIATEPNDVCHIDFIKMHETARHKKYACCIVDRHSKHVFSWATRNNDHKAAAQTLLEYIRHYGPPRKLVSDRGGEFVNEVISELCSTFGIGRVVTTAYHPQMDGQVERWNRTLLQILQCYVNAHLSDWDLYLGLADYAYNTSYNPTINASPYYVLFGREPILPFATAANEPELQSGSRTDLTTTLQTIWNEVRANIARAQRVMDIHYNRRHIDFTLDVGDLVMLHDTARNNKSSRKNKLRFTWNGPYRVTEKKSDLLYEIEPAVRGLHIKAVRDLVNIQRLKPYKLLPMDLIQEADELRELYLDADTLLPIPYDIPRAAGHSPA